MCAKIYLTVWFIELTAKDFTVGFCFTENRLDIRRLSTYK